MPIIPPINKFTKHQWMASFSTSFLTIIVWSVHFVSEFILLSRLNLPPSYILYHLGAVPIGAILSLTLFRKLKYSLLLNYFALILSIMIIIQFYSNSLMIGLLSLVGAGLCIGVINGVITEQIIFLYEEQEFTGRIVSAGSYLFILMYIGTFYLFTLEIFYPLMIVSMTLFSIVLTNKSVDHLDVPKQPEISIIGFLKDKENTSSILFSFFYGFFIINSYYAGILIFGFDDLPLLFSEFFRILFLTVVLTAFPVGFFLDFLGRKLTIIIGLYSQGILFLVLFLDEQSLVDISTNQLRFIIPVVLGFSFVLTLLGGILHFAELQPIKSSVRDRINLFTIFISIGMISGVVLEEMFFQNITIFSVILIFILFTTTSVVFQLKETLMSKEDINWRDSIQHIIILSKGGSPLYSQVMGDKVAIQNAPDELLIGGALIAISSLTKEISYDNSDLKVIKQEGYTILLEGGMHFYLHNNYIKRIRPD